MLNSYEFEFRWIPKCFPENGVFPFANRLSSFSTVPGSGLTSMHSLLYIRKPFAWAPMLIVSIEAYFFKCAGPPFVMNFFLNFRFTFYLVYIFSLFLNSFLIASIISVNLKISSEIGSFIAYYLPFHRHLWNAELHRCLSFPFGFLKIDSYICNMHLNSVLFINYCNAIHFHLDSPLWNPFFSLVGIIRMPEIGNHK